MIIDTHTHVVSSDKVKHPLDPGARAGPRRSAITEDLIAEMDRAGVDGATLVQPNATYGLDNSYQCDSAKQYAPRTVAVGILDPAAPDAADKLSYWVHERGMQGVRSRVRPSLTMPAAMRSGSAPQARHPYLPRRRRPAGEGAPDAERGGSTPHRPLCPGPLRGLEWRPRQGRDDDRPGKPGPAAQCLFACVQHQSRPLCQPAPNRAGALQARY